MTSLANADDTNYVAEFAGGKDDHGKDLDPVTWYQFSGQVLAYVGIGVDTDNSYTVPAYNVRKI